MAKCFAVRLHRAKHFFFDFRVSLCRRSFASVLVCIFFFSFSLSASASHSLSPFACISETKSLSLKSMAASKMCLIDKVKRNASFARRTHSFLSLFLPNSGFGSEFTPKSKRSRVSCVCVF